VQRFTASWERQIPATRLVFIVAAVVTVFYNIPLWLKLIHRFDGANLPNLLFLINFATVILAFNILLTSLLVWPKVAKPMLTLLLATCGSISYFNSIGVAIDEQMISSIAQTDAREATELMSVGFFGHLLLFVVAPVFLLYKIDIRFRPVGRELGLRLLGFLLVFLVSVGLFYSNFRFSTYFGRENRDLRVYMNPAFPLMSVRKAFAEEVPQTFQVIGDDAVQVKPSARRIVGIMIVGETARADHFSLNGYPRSTNPLLAKRDLINYSTATACGTSTAYSVPCMFSFMNAQNYQVDLAPYQSNVLDVLQVAGVHTFWRDNNSTCKGVCARSDNENLRTSPDPKSPYFNEGEYFDEALLDGLRERILNDQQDVLVVLHQLGSHGPAYHKRYPKSFEQFTPVCEEQNPADCSAAEISNSYDNTILYTDFIIDKAISLLEQLRDTDTFVMYASDHGESLGENGVYLHGLPKSIAPPEQLHVPFMLWLSPSLRQEHSLDSRSASRCATTPASHDNIVHTLLGLFHVDTAALNSDLDLLNHECI